MTRALHRTDALTRLARSFSGIEQRLGIAALAAALTLVAIDAAAAHGFKIGSIEIGHPWSRATPPGAKVGGGYLTLTNEADTPDTLVAVTLDGAEKAEIHQMSVTDGVMKMGKVEGGLVLPPHETVTLDPNGYHLMFIGLARPLVKGETARGTLTFEKAGTVAVDFAIDAIGATGKPAKGHDGHDGSGDAMPGMKMGN